MLFSRVEEDIGKSGLIFGILPHFALRLRLCYSADLKVIQKPGKKQAQSLCPERD
jgi:hypothetical protein